MKNKQPKFKSENLGYKYSGYLCRGMKTWRVTAPSGNIYSLLITVGRDGTNATGYVRRENEGENEEITVHPATYRKLMAVIKEREATA